MEALETFVGLSDPRISGLPPIPAGGFGWNREVPLYQDSLHRDPCNIDYIPQGTVSGTTVHGDDGQRPAHRCRRSASRRLAVDIFGQPVFEELLRLNRDHQTDDVRLPEHDSARYRTSAGLFARAGHTLRMISLVQAWSSIVQPGAPSAFNGELSTVTPDIDRHCSPASLPPEETNGTISGIVFMPDDVTTAPEGTQVVISFGDLTVTTDAEGRFFTVTLPRFRRAAMACWPPSQSAVSRVRSGRWSPQGATSTSASV